VSGATAIILARAGSKGVPGKNTRLVGGKPCIAWTIEHAQQAERVSRVVVSSDDVAALDIARHLGAEAIIRPPQFAHDTARVDDAARDALSRLNHAANDPVVILYANVPIRPPGLIDGCLEMLGTTGADSVQTYQPVGKYHPWWTARVDPASGEVLPWEGDVLNHGVFRRQDLPPAFIPDGAAIALTPAALNLHIPGVPAGPHAFFGRVRRGVINPEGSVIDIDQETDLLVADAMLRRVLEGHRP
jgi:CMP-N-acetylneuraminic acid synthetase